VKENWTEAAARGGGGGELEKEKEENEEEEEKMRSYTTATELGVQHGYVRSRS